MTRFVLLDGGQTGCRVAYVEDGKRVEDLCGPSLPRLSKDTTPSDFALPFSQLLSKFEHRSKNLDSVVAGLTGFGGDEKVAVSIATGIRSSVSANRVVITNDGVTSYLGAIGYNPGAIVAVGTGVIALAGDRDGCYARSDGWGYLLGDDGGGFYIGRKGLSEALRHHDGRGGSDVLVRKAEERFGKIGGLKGRIYDSYDSVGDIATFAVDVADAAREGDYVAQRIWSKAACEVARTVTAALHTIFDPATPVTVSWAGSVFKARDLILEPFKSHVMQLWPTARLQEPRGTALDGANLLANSYTSPMFGSLVHTFESESR